MSFMCGIFKIGYYHENEQILVKKVFAKTLRGALSKVSRELRAAPFKLDVTYTAIHSVEHPDCAYRRFYESGEPISPWITFDEAIDDV